MKRFRFVISKEKKEKRKVGVLDLSLVVVFAGYLSDL